MAYFLLSRNFRGYFLMEAPDFQAVPKSNLDLETE